MPIRAKAMRRVQIRFVMNSHFLLVIFAIFHHCIRNSIVIQLSYFYPIEKVFLSSAIYSKQLTLHLIGTQVSQAQYTFAVVNHATSYICTFQWMNYSSLPLDNRSSGFLTSLIQFIRHMNTYCCTHIVLACGSFVKVSREKCKIEWTSFFSLLITCCCIESWEPYILSMWNVFIITKDCVREEPLLF